MFRNTGGPVHTQPFNYLGHYACQLLNTVSLLPFALLKEHCHFHTSKTLTVSFCSLLWLPSEGLLTAQTLSVFLVKNLTNPCSFH